MVTIYNHLNEGTLAALVMIFSVLLFTGTLWLYQRYFPAIKMAEGSGDMAQIYSGAIGTIFALIFAFVIIAVWQNFDRVSATVSQEANVLHNIYRSLDTYPPAFRDPVQAELKVYVNRVVAVEWDKMSASGQDPLARDLFNQLNEQITAYRPATQGEGPLQQLMLQLVTQSRSLRHDRLKGAEPYLDKAMWVSLDLGCSILLFFSCILSMNNSRQHYLLNGVLGASMGLVFFLLLVYNFPMQGPGSITPEPLQVLPQQFWS